MVEQQEEQPQSLDVSVDVVGTEVDRSIETEGESRTHINLPIALRKESRSTTGKPPTRYGFEHDICNCVI